MTKSIKKILFVAMSDSIHAARWISQIIDQGWDIHLFPSFDTGRTHKDFHNITVHHSFYYRKENPSATVKTCGVPIFSSKIAAASRLLLQNVYPNYRANQLARLIKRLKPDLINSLEIQGAGYLTLAAREKYTREFPKWIVTIWGSDLYLFGQLRDHEQKIRNVLSRADYYSCECRRDVHLSKQLGFKGKILPPQPLTGGYHIDELLSLRKTEPTSKRKMIMLKGYQGWSGRALVGLRALERCADMLSGYTIIIHSAPDTSAQAIDPSGMKIAAEIFTKKTGIPITILPIGTPHRNILTFHGRARISIGLGISDGISVSLLEAMAMGSFPIQSWTSCADEWIKDGETGILVPPEDPDIIEKAVRKSLQDDKLVDRAAEKNFSTIKEKLDFEKLKKSAINFYSEILNDKQRRIF